MAHYLLEVGYTPESWNAQIASQANVVERITPALNACGATLENTYYAFGEADLVAIADFPRPEDAAAFALAVTSGGSLRRCTTTPLLSVEQGIESMRVAAELRKVYSPAVATASGAGASNAAVLRKGYTAFAQGDIATVLGLFDPSIIWHSPDSISFGGTYVGPAAVGEFFAKLPEHYSELHVEPDRYIDDGDSVVVLGHTRGRTRAGAAYDLPFVHVWTLADGKATSCTEYFDTAKMNAALGAGAQARA